MVFQSFSYKKASVSYVQVGTGDKPFLFILSGYAQNITHFERLIAVFAEKYTVIAFEWPAHGHTHWPYEVFAPEDVAAWLRRWLGEGHGAAYGLLGYSFGARAVQSILPYLSAPPAAIFFLAPDGFQTKGMSWALFAPQWLRHKLLSKAIYWQRIAHLGHFLHKKKLLPPSVGRFMSQHRSLQDWQRLRLFGLSLPLFQPSQAAFFSFLDENRPHFFLFLGENDGIVPIHLGEKISQKYPQVQIIPLPTGHFLFGNALNKAVVALLSTL